MVQNSFFKLQEIFSHISVPTTFKISFVGQKFSENVNIKFVPKGTMSRNFLNSSFLKSFNPINHEKSEFSHFCDFANLFTIFDVV